MSSRRKLVILLLLVLVMAFTGGLYRLMALRFEAGDVFPPYSSLRSDPLGTKLLFQSLKRLPGFSVQQHFQSPQKLTAREESTIFFCGLDPQALQWWSQEDMATFRQLFGNGNRLVLALLPVRDQVKSSTAAKEEGKPLEQEHGDRKSDTARKRMLDELGFRFDFLPLADDGGPPLAKLAAEASDSSLPPAFSSHSTLHFVPLDPAWRTIYEHAGLAVVMERSFSGGSLVLMADSYLLSNEALFMARQSALITWLLGDNRRIVFDEAHLGVARSPGIMVLVRQYRLAGLLCGLLLLAGLFIWQRLVPFVPAQTKPADDGVDEVDRMDYQAGLVSLLRRSVQAEQLLPTCVAEWRKSLLAEGKGLQPQIEKIDRVVGAEQARPSRERNPLATYKIIAGILAERKWLWK